MNERWEKVQATGLSKKEAVDTGFAAALSNPPQTLNTPVSPPIRRNLVQLEQQHVELELGQSLLVDANSIVKFFSTTEGIVAMQTVDDATLQIVGTHFGSTFVHVYDAAGRTTFEVQCVPPTYKLTTSQIRQMEEIEKTRPFRFGYSVGRSAFYTGDTFSQRERTSVDLNQTFKLAGDTPYGYLSANAFAQKNRDKIIITDQQVALQDGKIGPWRGFDLYAGDSSVSNGLMAFPQARIRGARLNQRLNDGKTEAKGFYGREKFGIIGTLSSTLRSKRSSSAHQGGLTIDHRFDKVNRVKLGYFNGHGRARAGGLNKHAVGAKADVALGPRVVYSPEVDFDNEHFAEKQTLKYRSDNLRIRGEFRDISKSFTTMVGAPGQRGELGWLLDASSELTDNLTVRGSLDVFRDRLIPNPVAKTRYNAHRELGLTWAIDRETNFSLNYQDFDDTGRLGPTKQKTVGGQLNRVIEPFDHRVVLFSRYQNRGFRNLLSSTNNYVVDQIFLGAQTSTFFGIGLTIEKQFDFVRSPNLDEHSMPNITTYTLDWSRQLGATPFSVNARLRFRDEEETEATNSFMSGNDTTDLTLGLYYRELEDREFFVTCRFANYVPESLRIASPRVEAELLAGVSYDWDTGFYWATVGAFEGFVFKDLNGDGKRDENEPGIPGVMVSAGEKQATTDEKGFYELKGVPGKRTRLRMETSQLPYGFSPTTSSGRDVEIRGGKPQQVDFGVTPRSEIKGIVFNDLNGNGKFDLTDKGLPKVTLLLEDGRAERTKVSGGYFFSNVVAGAHTVRLDLMSVPPGYLPVGPTKKDLAVFEGIRYEHNFPLRAVRAVAGRVFMDDNANLQMDANEKGVPAVLVQIGGVSAVTDADGYFLFDDLPPGKHTMEADPKTLPEGMKPTFKPRIEMTEEPQTLTEKNFALSSPKPKPKPKTAAVDQRVTQV